MEQEQWNGSEHTVYNESETEVMKPFLSWCVTHRICLSCIIGLGYTQGSKKLTSSCAGKTHGQGLTHSLILFHDFSFPFRVSPWSSWEYNVKSGRASSLFVLSFRDSSIHPKMTYQKTISNGPFIPGLKIMQLFKKYLQTQTV